MVNEERKGFGKVIRMSKEQTWCGLLFSLPGLFALREHERETIGHVKGQRHDAVDAQVYRDVLFETSAMASK